ncbi:MAG: hypothetical protein IPN26_14405 [Bacteroidetes bacterium]|nr:hypothetical protein [Bacteroidota bacterium]
MIKRTLGIYLAKHPLALAIPGDIWALQVNYIKMTDSTLGFGKNYLDKSRTGTEFDLQLAGKN